MKQLLFTLFTLLTVSVFAQSPYEESRTLGEEESRGVVYTSETAFNLRLHTNGYAFGVDLGKMRTYYSTRILTFEFGELHHPKEIRQGYEYATQTGQVSRPVRFGKQNNLFVVRGGIGEKRYFTEKARRKGVALGMSYAAGPVLGLLKPYYIEVYEQDVQGTRTQSIRYSEETEAMFLDDRQIFGSSPITRGLGETSLRPGAFGRAAIHLDWGAFDRYVRAVEAGIMVDGFFGKTPIMVEPAGTEGVENKALFINFFVNISFGVRK